MRIVVLFTILIGSLFAQPSVIGTPQLLINNGPSSNKIDLLVMSDGWWTHNIQEFRDIVDPVIPELFDRDWYRGHFDQFNVWRIDVSGTFGTHPASSAMMPTDMANLRLIAGLIPYDQIALMVKNSYLLGGWSSANDIDLFTIRDGPHATSIATFIHHEMAHTLGGMVDEYVPFGTPYPQIFPSDPIRAALSDVNWGNVTVWGMAGDYANLSIHRPFWARIMGPNTIMNRPLSDLHHWYWDTSTWEGGAHCDFGIWSATPSNALRTTGAAFNSVQHNVLTKKTANFIPLDPQLQDYVQLLYPAHAAFVYGPKMTFSWGAVNGATDYHLLVKRWITDETYLAIPTNSLGLEIFTAALLPGERYDWTVIAANNNNETPDTIWWAFGFMSPDPYITSCGDLDRDGQLTLADADILADVLYYGAYLPEDLCEKADVNSDGMLTHTLPVGFGDIEIIRYWAQCDPISSPSGCGSAPGHPGVIPPVPDCSSIGPITGCSTQTFKCGDYNNDGVVNVLDALLVAQNSAGVEVIDPSNPNAFRICGAADTSRDQIISIIDALLIARFAAGMDPQLYCDYIVPNPDGTLPSWCN